MQDGFWAIWGVALSVLLAAVWLIAASRAKPGWVGLCVGFAHVCVAGLHVAAPFRAIGDPFYAGYQFGALSAPPGWLAAALSSGVLILAVVGAFNALKSDRRARLRTAATSALFLIALGGAWAHNAFTHLHGDMFRLGGGLTLSGAPGAALAFFLFIAPFLLGALAITRQTRSPA